MEDEVAAWLRGQAEVDLAAARIISNGGFEPQHWDTDPPGQVNPPADPGSAAVSAAIRREPEYSSGWVPVWAWDQVTGEPVDEEPATVAVIAELGRRQFDHVIRHDPRTEAARAESVLAVIDEYEGADDFDLEEGVSEGRDYDERVRDEAVKGALGYVVRELAYGYRHREGFKEEWKP